MNLQVQPLLNQPVLNGVTSLSTPQSLKVAPLISQAKVSGVTQAAPQKVSGVVGPTPQQLNPNIKDATGANASPYLGTPQEHTIADLGWKIKQKVPGVYDDLSDADLGAKIKIKFPEYADFADNAPQPVQQQSIAQGVYTDLIKPLGGIAKPFVQGLVSAGRSIQSIPAGIKGIQETIKNPNGTGAFDEANQTMSKPVNLPFLDETKPLAALSSGQAVGLGLQVGSNLIGLGEEGTLPSIAGGFTKQAVKQGFKQGLTAGAGSALENNPNPQFNVPTALNTAGGAIQGGFQGALTAGLSSKFQPLFTGETTPFQAVKDTGNAIVSPVKTIKNTLSPDVEASLTRAIKPGKNNTNFLSDLKTTIPLVNEISLATGKPITDLESFDNAITATKQKVWADYQNILEPNGKATIDGNKIADSMVSALDKRFIAQNPDKAAAIRAVADTYRKPIPLADAEEFLQSANNDLHAYYAKNKVSQQVALKDPEKGYVVKEAEGIRDALYSKLNELTGKDAAQIKKAYGSLTNLQNEVIGRKNVTARQAPVSLGQQFSRISAAGDLIKGIDLTKPGQTLANVGSGIGKIVLGNHMRNLNDSDYLVNNAFSKLSKQPLIKSAKVKSVK